MTPTWLLANLNRPCTIRRRVKSGTDEYGNDTYSTVDTETTCFLQPVSETEIQLGRAGVGALLLHLPAEAESLVDAYVQFVVGGVTYEADGPPAVHRALHASRTHHVEVALIRSQA